MFFFLWKNDVTTKLLFQANYFCVLNRVFPRSQWYNVLLCRSVWADSFCKCSNLMLQSNAQRVNRLLEVTWFTFHSVLVSHHVKWCWQSHLVTTILSLSEAVFLHTARRTKLTRSQLIRSASRGQQESTWWEVHHPPAPTRVDVKRLHTQTCSNMQSRERDLQYALLKRTCRNRDYQLLKCEYFWFLQCFVTVNWISLGCGRRFGKKWFFWHFMARTRTELYRTYCSAAA